MWCIIVLNDTIILYYTHWVAKHHQKSPFLQQIKIGKQWCCLQVRRGRGRSRNSPKNKETVILASLTRMSVLLYVWNYVFHFGVCQLCSGWGHRPVVITWKRCPSDSNRWSPTKGPFDITFTLLTWWEVPIRFFKRVIKTGAKTWSPRQVQPFNLHCLYPWSGWRSPSDPWRWADLSPVSKPLGLRGHTI